MKSVKSKTPKLRNEKYVKLYFEKIACDYQNLPVYTSFKNLLK